LTSLRRLLPLCLLLASCFTLSAQGPATTPLDHAIAFPSKAFGWLDQQAARVQERLDRQTEKYLYKLERKEAKLRKKLARKDSALSAQIFGDLDQRYAQLKATSGKVGALAASYSGRLDSLTTSLKLLQQSSLTGLSNNPEAQKLLLQYQSLQSRFNVSDQIRKQLQQREALLKETFQQLGLVKELKAFEKQVYYYQAQVQQYKQDLADPCKLAQKLISLAQSLPQFKDFFAHNSLLGSLFALPGSTPSTVTASLAGLQTRALVSQSLQNRFGSSAAIIQQLQQNVQNAQAGLDQWRSALESLKSGSLGNSSSDLSTRDFKPNEQKTKPLLKRLEYGFNVQSQKAQYYFPTTTDFGLSLGYKLNDQSMVGIGLSYKVGWGTGWDHFKVTHQGVGLRSYVDYQLKGSFYLSGGYEQNYRSEFHSIAQLQPYSAWQSSGLLGVTKKYQINRKLKGNVQLLWDFLSYQQRPQTQPVLFRIGYSIH
jgi:hypothetical protein